MPTNDCKPLPQLSDRDIARFWKYVDIRQPDECWFWTGGIDHRGYGNFHTGTRTTRRNLRAHKVALFINSGIDPFPLHSLHLCDVNYSFRDKTYRKCCNPSHLISRTPAENQAHMVESGRSGRGIHSPRAKLNVQQILEIRNRYSKGNITEQNLGIEYRVSRSTIGQIVNRKNWSYIVGP